MAHYCMGHTMAYTVWLEIVRFGSLFFNEAYLGLDENSVLLKSVSWRGFQKPLKVAKFFNWKDTIFAFNEWLKINDVADNLNIILINKLLFKSINGLSIRIEF